jgi:flagellar capping protein FliD
MPLPRIGGRNCSCCNQMGNTDGSIYKNLYEIYLKFDKEILLQNILSFNDHDNEIAYQIKDYYHEGYQTELLKCLKHIRDNNLFGMIKINIYNKEGYLYNYTEKYKSVIKDLIFEEDRCTIKYDFKEELKINDMSRELVEKRKFKLKKIM